MQGRQIDKKYTIQVRMSRDYAKMLKLIAVQEGTSIRELIDGIAIDIIDQHGLLKR
jgi:hypothetical protein